LPLSRSVHDFGGGVQPSDGVLPTVLVSRFASGRTSR